MIDNTLKVVVLRQHEALATNTIRAKTHKEGKIKLVRIPLHKSANDYLDKLLVTDVGFSPRFAFLEKLPNNPQVFTELMEKKFWFALSKYRNLVIILSAEHQPLPGTNDFDSLDKHTYTTYKVMVNTTGKEISELLSTSAMKKFKGKERMFINPTFKSQNTMALMKRASKIIANYPPPLIDRMIEQAKTL